MVIYSKEMSQIIWVLLAKILLVKSLNTTSKSDLIAEVLRFKGTSGRQLVRITDNQNLVFHLLPRSSNELCHWPLFVYCFLFSPGFYGQPPSIFIFYILDCQTNVCLINVMGITSTSKRLTFFNNQSYENRAVW